MERDAAQETLQRLTEQVAFSGKRVLELGCGAGRITRTYAAETVMTVGVEPEADAVRSAATDIPGALFVRGSGMKLPFPPRTFDIVLFTLSLHHHPDPAAALVEAGKVLMPGGRILVLEPTPESEVQRLCNVFENEDRELATVERVLSRIRPEPLSKQTFQTRRTFKNFDDVADFGFNYYRQPPDPKKRQALRTFLGPKADSRPVEMTDTLRLTVVVSAA
jgi:ubiquinone/menaquinone biosynthesis C-methylase UbiE